MKFWEVIKTDLDSCYGRKIGNTIIKRSANKKKVDEFVKDWEAKWQENLKNNNAECGHCWMDSDGKLNIIERELEDC